jgi:hypothetical protein
MRLTFLAAVALALGVMSSSARAQQQFELFASIVDGTGAAPATVEPADIRVMENGAEAKVVKVEPVSWPSKVQLLVDNGVGLGSNNIQILKDGMTGLVNALPDGVEITIVTTAPQGRFLVKPTTDKKAALDGLSRLSPDSGTGRFVESLNEAMQRIEKDKGDFFPTIVMVGTSAGDSNVMERDVKKIFERIQAHPTTVHVVFLNASGSATGGANQTQVGIAVTQFTRGRYESIAAATRLATLLPEIGQQVAESIGKQAHQFRLTLERPGGAKGDLGQVTAATRGSLSLRALSMDGRVP